MNSFGRAPLGEVLGHELWRFFSGELGLVESESAGLCEGFVVMLLSRAIVFVVGVGGADGAPHAKVILLVIRVVVVRLV